MQSKFLAVLFAILFGLTNFTFSQSIEIELVEQRVKGFPGVHSNAVAFYQNKIIIVGGRLEGTHMRRPFESFLYKYNNKNIYIIDAKTFTTDSISLKPLNQSLQDQLCSTNMEFFQEGKMLYFVGGYGNNGREYYDKTYPNLTKIDLDLLLKFAKNKKNLPKAFAQITNEKMAVTGGHLDKIGDYFYLVGGQRFDGKYNPMGPDHGPGFKQIYTNAVRKFKIEASGDSMKITNYSEIYDDFFLHKRDYNLSPFLDNGQKKLSAFSGVFHEEKDIPFLNIVETDENSYKYVPLAKQLLNQYHTARIPIYNASKTSNSVIFLGGIGRFSVDSENSLYNHSDPPFLSTISAMNRNKNGLWEESFYQDTMPKLLGASAELIFLPKFENDGMLQYSSLSDDFQTVAYMIGGIQANIPHPFDNNKFEDSEASAVFYKIRLKKSDNNKWTKIKAITDFPHEIDASVSFEKKTLTSKIKTINKSDFLKIIVQKEGKTIFKEVLSEKKPINSENGFEIYESETKLKKGIYQVIISDGLGLWVQEMEI